MNFCLNVTIVCARSVLRIKACSLDFSSVGRAADKWFLYNHLWNEKFASNGSFSLSCCRSLCSSRGLIFQDAPAPPFMSINICLLNPSDLKVLSQLCSLLPTCSCSAFGQLFTVADAESWFLQGFGTCVSDVLPLHSILEELLPLKMNWIKLCQEPWSVGMALQGTLLCCVSMRQWPLLDLDCCTAASQKMGRCVTEAEHSAPGSVQPVTTPKELKNYF